MNTIYQHTTTKILSPREKFWKITQKQNQIILKFLHRNTSMHSIENSHFLKPQIN